MNAGAQPQRIDPGDPPTPGGTEEGWQFLSIPGLPAHAVLGDVWASPAGDVYVWAKYPPASAGLVSPTDEPGEELPGPPSTGPKLWSSTLYRYDGMRWSMSLRTPKEMGNTLLGAANGEIFATTTAQSGEARVYHFNGTSWAPVILPDHYFGQLHTLAGLPYDLYLKIDRVILHYNGAGFTKVFEMPADEAPVRGLVYVDWLHLFAMCPDGQYTFDTGTWTPCHEAISFSDVEDAWGMRDGSGRLQMYAVGSNVNDNCLRVWRFNETDPVTHAGEWATVVTDPDPAIANMGCGLHVWGAAGNDVYATGVVDGEGHLMRFDGTAWRHLVPPEAVGTVHGVSGTATGPVWFSTESGRMIRYVRSPGDVPSAAPVAERLGPPDPRTPAAHAALQTALQSGTLRVRYALSESAPVHLAVYDVLGRLRGTIANGVGASGVHEAAWNVSALSPGVYFVKLRTPNAAFANRVIIE